MAFVPDKPVRIREYLSDGTAHDVTVGLVPEDDSIEVLDENALENGDVYRQPVYYDKEQTEKLKKDRKSREAEAEKAEADKAKKSTVNKEVEAPK